MFRVSRVGFKGLSQPEQKLIHATGLHFAAYIPNLCEQLLATDHPSLILDKVPQERQLFMSELDIPSVDGDLIRFEIDYSATEADFGDFGA